MPIRSQRVPTLPFRLAPFGDGVSLEHKPTLVKLAQVSRGVCEHGCPKRAQPDVGGTTLNLWEVSGKCRKPCGEGVMKTTHHVMSRDTVPINAAVNLDYQLDHGSGSVEPVLAKGSRR
jgi:hypothetical protein